MSLMAALYMFFLLQKLLTGPTHPRVLAGGCKQSANCVALWSSVEENHFCHISLGRELKAGKLVQYGTF